MKYFVGFIVGAMACSCVSSIIVQKYIDENRAIRSEAVLNGFATIRDAKLVWKISTIDGRLIEKR